MGEIPDSIGVFWKLSNFQVGERFSKFVAILMNLSFNFGKSSSSPKKKYINQSQFFRSISRCFWHGRYLLNFFFQSAIFSIKLNENRWQLWKLAGLMMAEDYLNLLRLFWEVVGVLVISFENCRRFLLKICGLHPAPHHQMKSCVRPCQIYGHLW